MSYALYTVSPQTVSRFGTRNLVFSIPFVIYGIYRYLYLIHQKNMGGNPTREMVSDIPLLINALLWAWVSHTAVRSVGVALMIRAVSWS
jgi:hypothetical protein